MTGNEGRKLYKSEINDIIEKTHDIFDIAIRLADAEGVKYGPENGSKYRELASKLYEEASKHDYSIVKVTRGGKKGEVTLFKGFCACGEFSKSSPDKEYLEEITGFEYLSHKENAIRNVLKDL